MLFQGLLLEYNLSELAGLFWFRLLNSDMCQLLQWSWSNGAFVSWHLEPAIAKTTTRESIGLVGRTVNAIISGVDLLVTSLYERKFFDH